MKLTLHLSSGLIQGTACPQTSSHVLRSAVIAVGSAFLIGLLGALPGCGPKVRPRFPDVPHVELPAARVSTVNVRFSVDLDATQAVAESKVPRQLTQGWPNGAWKRMDGGPDAPHCGYGLRYIVDRAPLNMSLTPHGSIQTGIKLSYAVQARYRWPCPGPLFEFKCGYDGESRRKATSTLLSTIDIPRDWRARVSTTVGPVVATNRCELSFLKIDVTDQITSFFRQSLGTAMESIDSKLTSDLDLRVRAERAWATLSTSQEIGDELWLDLRPERFALSPLSVRGRTLTATARLEASPRIVLGSKPASITKPLPDLQSGVEGSSFNLFIPVQLPYEAINSQLDRAVDANEGGIRYPPVGKRHITVTSVRVYSYGASAVLRVNFKGSAKGHLYLVGTPHLDTVRNRITFPDLDYNLETKNLILKVLDWLEHDKLRDDLRGRVVIDLSEEVTDLKRRIHLALNRQLGAITLRGQLVDLRLLGVYADPEKAQFVAYTSASGSLECAVGP